MIYPLINVYYRMFLFIKRIYRRLRELLDSLNFLKYISFPLGQKIWIMGSPLHGNLGDSAILVAERKMLLELEKSKECIKEISNTEYIKYRKWLLRFISPKDIMTYIGGGNMGDVWFEEEKVRRLIVTDFSHRDFIFFPQTIFYSQTSTGAAEEKSSISIYNQPQFFFVAREAVSYEKIQTIYPTTKKLLTPDIVLSTSAADYGVIPCKRKGILLCFRKDCEMSFHAGDVKRLEEFTKRLSAFVTLTDMVLTHGVTKENRLYLLNKKMQEFASSELVVTDRLHGMIFSAITATPCVVFSNNNHKIRGTYDWISYLPYIKFVNNIDEAERVIPELLNMKDCQYDNTPLRSHYEKLKAAIANRLV